MLIAEKMSFSDKVSEGVSTTIIGMSIVFMVLIGLCLILVFQSKIIRLFARQENSTPAPAAAPAKVGLSEEEKRGLTSGEVFVEGVDNEEMLALIMAVVSQEAEMPLKQLRFKSIKAL